MLGKKDDVEPPSHGEKCTDTENLPKLTAEEVGKEKKGAMLGPSTIKKE